MPGKSESYKFDSNSAFDVSNLIYKIQTKKTNENIQLIYNYNNREKRK